MKKNLPSWISIIIFLTLLIAPTLLYFFIGENTEEMLEEKRGLAELPERFSESFFTDLENWYNDHAPYRLTVITAQKQLAQNYNGYYRNRIRPVLSAYFTPSWYNEEYKRWAGLDVPYLAPMEDGLVEYGRDDWLYYNGENSTGFYRGNNLLDPEELPHWKDAFASLQKICDEKGIRLAYLIVPNKEQIYPEFMASYKIENLPKREEIIYEYMAQNGVPILYPLKDFLQLKTDRTIYLQQDSHWNQIGAYYAMTKVYELLGMSAPSLDDVQISQTVKRGNDLSNFTGYATDYLDYILSYKPEITCTAESLNDGRLEIFTSSAGTGHNMVLIGDSMRDYNKDFYARDFDKSTVLFRTELEDPVVTRELLDMKAGDVLLIQITERHDEAILDVTRYLLSLLADQTSGNGS